MPNLPTEGVPAAGPEQIVRPEQAGLPKSVEQKAPVTQRAKDLLNRFIPWIRKSKPDPDMAVQAIATAPLQKPEQLAPGQAAQFDAMRFQRILREGSEEEVSKLRKFVVDNIGNPRSPSPINLSTWIGRRFYGTSDGKYPERQNGEMLVGDVLKKYGLDPTEYLNAWVASTSPKKLTTVIERNLKTVVSLETKNPGLCQTLTKEFGIRAFGRYPEEMLLRQFEQKDKANIPYGIFLAGKGDWNGASYGKFEVYQKLFSQLDGKYAMRLFEVGSKNDIARALISSDKKYGPKHKISFAFMEGHGNSRLMHFGVAADRPKREFIHQGDLSGKGVRRTPEFFIPNPTVVLFSCEVGQKNGLAQEMSSLGAKVIGSEIKSSVTDIKVIYKKAGGIDFDVQYNKSPYVDSAYIGGKEQKRPFVEKLMRSVQSKT